MSSSSSSAAGATSDDDAADDDSFAQPTATLSRHCPDTTDTATITTTDTTTTITTTDTTNNNSSNNNNLTLRIQTATGRPQTVSVVEHASVACLKQTVAAATAKQTSMNNNSHHPYIRLIAAGRLLAPDTALLREFSLQSEQVVHAVIVHTTSSSSCSTISQSGVQAAVQQGRATEVHAGVNAQGWAVRRPEQDDDDDDDEGILYNDDAANEDDIEAGTRRRTHRTAMGFDRLRATAGLRRGEITALRIYFHDAIDRWLLQHDVLAQEIHRQEPHDALRRRRVQEERWMDAQGPASEFRMNVNLQQQQTTNDNTMNGMPGGGGLRSFPSPWRGPGTDRDFVWGFLLGFCVGFFMLVWVWMPTVPHKQKLGILTGYCFHLTLGMVRGGGTAGNHPEGEYYSDDVLILSD